MKFIVLKDTEGLNCIIALDSIQSIEDFVDFRNIVFKEDENDFEVSNTINEILYEIRSLATKY